jgi:DNA-3-methyladenine glycosylase I
VVARFDGKKIERLLTDPGIVRNRLKVQATVANARALLEIREEFGSFAAYQWRFVEDRPLVNHWRTIREIPAFHVHFVMGRDNSTWSNVRR